MKKIGLISALVLFVFALSNTGYAAMNPAKSLVKIIPKSIKKTTSIKQQVFKLSCKTTKVLTSCVNNKCLESDCTTGKYCVDPAAVPSLGVAQCITPSSMTNFTCVDDKTKQFTATIKGKSITLQESCPNINVCFSGKCLSPEDVTCTDSDKTNLMKMFPQLSVIVPGSVEVKSKDGGDSVKYTDKCETDKVLLEQACDNKSPVKPPSTQVDCTEINADSKCITKEGLAFCDAAGLSDQDKDKIPDIFDNCLSVPNADQVDVCGPAQVSAGGSHTCLLVKNTGAVKCWGLNEKGQLGNGKYGNSNVPVDVIDLKDATFISTGQNHTCALIENGVVKCWGSNMKGQLGTTKVSPTGSAKPIDVEGLDGEIITAISAGTTRTVAVTKEGALKWWGNIPSSEWIAADVAGLANEMTAATSGDEHTCALTDSDKVQCWQYAITAQTGYIAEGIKESISSGPKHACAVTDDNGVKCWGLNDHGQLGNGNTQPTSTTTTVVDADLDINIKAVSAGGNHTCALYKYGDITCWGDNANGQLGNNSTVDCSTPADYDDDYSIAGYYFTGISAGGSHTCALSDEGSVWCWGSNAFGQLGDGTNADRHIPTKVTVTY